MTFSTRKRLLSKKAKDRIETSNSNNNQLNIPQTREALDKFKMQAAQEVDVNLQSGDNGHLTFPGSWLRQQPDGQEDVSRKNCEVRTAEPDSLGHTQIVQYMVSLSV